MRCGIFRDFPPHKNNHFYTTQDQFIQPSLWVSLSLSHIHVLMENTVFSVN